MADSKSIYVLKKVSEKEPFSYDKIIASVLRAGVPMQNAEPISRSVEKWVIENAKNGEIKSSQIRDKVYESLLPEFPSEADSYQAYVKED